MSTLIFHLNGHMHTLTDVPATDVAQLAEWFATGRPGVIELRGSINDSAGRFDMADVNRLEITR